MIIGRAALHNPFIFRDIVAHVTGHVVEDETDRRIEAMMRYLRKIDGAPQIEKWKLHKARTVIGWFSKGIPNAKHLRTVLNDIASIDDVLRLMDITRELAVA